MKTPFGSNESKGVPLKEDRIAYDYGIALNLRSWLRSLAS